MKYKDEYRRNLPHIQPKDAIFFITFRLANTLSKNILDEYIIEKKRLIKQTNHSILTKLYFEKTESYLDHQNDGFLKEEPISKVIKKSIFFYDERFYNTIAFCIMPNHVHLIINTMNYPYLPLAKILQRIKGYSARQINLLRKTKGTVWQAESYDHVIRSRNELESLVEYTINNPVKAGFVSHWSKWKHTFVKKQFLENE